MMSMIPSGIFFIIPCTDEYRKVDLRTLSFDVPPQEVKIHLELQRGVLKNKIYFSV